MEVANAKRHVSRYSPRPRALLIGIDPIGLIPLPSPFGEVFLWPPAPLSVTDPLSAP